MQKISICEEKVMLVIWQNNELLSYKEVQIGVNERFGDSWKPETVCTYIDRLRKKSYIVPVKEGRYTYCQATMDFEEYKKERLKEFVDRLYDGDKLKLMGICVSEIMVGNICNASLFIRIRRMQKNLEQ